MTRQLELRKKFMIDLRTIWDIFTRNCINNDNPSTGLTEDDLKENVPFECISLTNLLHIE